MNPRLETPRLVLRPVTLADAPDVQRLVGDWAVARTLARVPHPYTDGMAEEWIESLAGGFASGTAFVFALEPRSDGAFIGVVGIERSADGVYVLGYWLGRSYWGRGYMTEAAVRAGRYAFDDGSVDRINASAQPENAASIAILRRLGMADEGRTVMDFPARGERREVIRFSLRHEDFEVHG